MNTNCDKSDKRLKYGLKLQFSFNKFAKSNILAILLFKV